jgi:hypothetical protein
MIARTLCLLAVLPLQAGLARADDPKSDIPVPPTTSAPATTKAPATTPAATSTSLLSSTEVLLSTVMQEHQSSFSGLGLRGRIKVPQLIEGFTVMPSIEYWRNQSTIQTFDIQTVRKDATLAAILRYDWKHEGWAPYAGAGWGVHFMSSEVNAPVLGLNDASDSTIKGALEALGGVSFGLAGRLGNVIELEYHHLPGEAQLKLNWGLSIAF